MKDVLGCALLMGFACSAFGATASSGQGTPALADLELHRAHASLVEYKGRQAVKLTQAETADGGSLAVLKTGDFGDGTIEVMVAGAPGAGAGQGARGFIGLAFRVSADASRYEHIYLRPTNGRADDQLRRNHSTQYESLPEYPWHRLRKEEPGKYESYVDLEPGVWTSMKIVVRGNTAQLYVHGAEQPALIVNDLKLGAGKGKVALHIGPGTEGYFADLRVQPD
jgi:hypothetical protein